MGLPIHHTAKNTTAMTIHYDFTTSVSGEQLSSALQGVRVLFVDEDELSHFLVKGLFEQTGIAGILAHDFGEALAAGPGGVDCVILDPFLIPGNGKASVAQLRATFGFAAAVPFLAALAGPEPADIHACEAAGFAGILAKPFSLQDFFSELGQALGRMPAPPMPPEPSPVPERAERVTLPDTPCIDVREGGARFGDNGRILARILERFRVEQRNSAQEIADALERNDTLLAERLAHSLKGVAGSICAPGLEAAARLLDATLKGNDPAPLAEQLAALRDESGRVIAALDAWHAQVAAEHPIGGAAPAAFDPKAAQEALERLRGALQRRRPVESEQGLKELQAWGWPQPLVVALTDLAQGIRKYRFREAEALVDDLLNRLRQGG